MQWKSSNFCLCYPTVSIGILLLYLAWQSRSEAVKSHQSNPSVYDQITENSKNNKINNMTCHVCHSEGNDECFNFTKQGEDFVGFPQQCETDNQICMVRKFAFTTSSSNSSAPMKTFALKRNCSSSCENGCVIMGERTRLYVCSQCCDSPLCNIGSGGGSIHISKAYYLRTASAHHQFLENTGSSFLHFIQIFVTVMILRFPL